jgi:hypothetical protein
VVEVSVCMVHSSSLEAGDSGSRSFSTSWNGWSVHSGYSDCRCAGHIKFPLNIGASLGPPYSVAFHWYM